MFAGLSPANGGYEKVKRRRNVLRDNIAGLTKNAIQRLGHVAGCKELSGLMYDEVRVVTKVFMENVIKDAVEYSTYAKRKTVGPEDVLHSLERQNRKILSNNQEETTKRCDIYHTDSEGKKKVKRHRGTKALSEIRFYQKQHDCFHISKSAFERIVKEIGQDFNAELRWSARAIALIQVATETYVVKLLEDSNLAAIHAHRITVYPKDLQLVRLLRGEPN